MHLSVEKAGAELVLRQTLGSGEQYPHGIDRVPHGGRGGRVGDKAVGAAMREVAAQCWQAQQVPLNKAMLGDVVQIIQNRLIGFSDGFFDVVHFQRPDRICGSFPSTFKLTGLV